MKKIIFTGDVNAKPNWLLKRPKFNQELAQFIVGLNKSGADIIDWCLEEIYEHSELGGKLFDAHGVSIPMSACHIEEEFGEDARRYANAYKHFAFNPPKQRIQDKCVRRIMFWDMARTIYRNVSD